MTETRVTRAAKKPRPSRRRREILEAATRVFHEKGYESTSIQDIAHAVGILKGSLYYYITSKEDLLYEIIRRNHEEALKNLRRSRVVEGNALVKIRVFMDLHLAYNAANLEKTAVFFHEFRSLSPEHREAIVEERDAYEHSLRDLIAQGQSEGVICPDVDPKLVAIGILGMMNWLYHWYRPGAERTVEEIASAYTDFVVAGLACDPATHRPGHRAQAAALPGPLGSAAGLAEPVV